MTLFCKPCACIGSAIPSGGMPLKPKLCSFGHLFYTLLCKARLRELRQRFLSLKESSTRTPVSFGTGLSEESQKILWAHTDVDLARVEGGGASCVCSGHEYVEKGHTVCCITGTATNARSWKMRATEDWHFYRQETVDRNQLLTRGRGVLGLEGGNTCKSGRGTIYMLFQIASSSSGNPVHRPPDDAPMDDLPSCWQRVSTRTYYTCQCRTKGAITEGHICHPSARHRAAFSDRGNEVREVRLLFLSLSSSETFGIKQSLWKVTRNNAGKQKCFQLTACGDALY